MLTGRLAMTAAVSPDLPKVSVQKVGAVLRKAGFERARWLKSGQIRGWGNWTPGHRVRLHWAGYVEVTSIEGSWARGTDEERETKHDARLAELEIALAVAGLPVERHKDGDSWAELRVPIARALAERGDEKEG